MSVFVLSAIVAASSSGDDIGFARYLIPGISVAIGFAIIGWIFSRRTKANAAAAMGAAPDVLGFSIAPARPLADTIAQLRELVGDTSAAPKITRYSRPFVTVDASGLKISEKKTGAYLTVPAADIALVEAGPAKHRHQAAFVANTYPSIWLTVRHGAAEAKVAIAPIVGVYDKISRAHALALAAEISARLGLPQA
jgi:hypothetical protein